MGSQRDGSAGKAICDTPVDLSSVHKVHTCMCIHIYKIQYTATLKVTVIDYSVEEPNSCRYLLVFIMSHNIITPIKTS